MGDVSSPPKRRRFGGISTVGAGLTLLWAFFCNMLIELLQGVSPAVSLGSGIDRFMLGSALVWIVLLLVLALTNRVWTSAALLLSATLAIGYANRLKLEFRHEPLYPSDVAFSGQIGFLSSIIGVRRALVLVVIMGLSAATVLLAGRVLGGPSPAVVPRGRRTRVLGVVSRGAAAALCVSALVYSTHFNAPGNRWRQAFDATGARWAPWDQAINYQRNTFIGGWLYNTRVVAMNEPPGYNAAAMRRVAAKYAAVADEQNAARDPHALDNVNVVVVLSESFSDPTSLRGLRLSEDPIPFTRSLMRRTTSGSMLAQGIGGGTANMEFEALTGMSMRQFSPTMQTAYQSLVPGYTSFPSSVGYFEAHGHSATAIHPYDLSVYQRRTVYPVLGFQRLVDRDSMQSAKELPNSNFVSDASAFEEVEHQIATSARPLMVNLVTMQNHMAWKSATDEKIKVSGLDGEARRACEAYVRGLRQSDDALRDFVGRLSDSHEKTVVLLYGDHLPGLYPPTVHEANGDLRMHQTPFVLWSNFTSFPRRELPVTSPTHFIPLILDAMDAPVPPYYALLKAVADEVPAMEGNTVLAADGSRLDDARLSPQARETLDDYRLVQYDLSVGHRYALRSMFYTPHDLARTGSASR